MRKTVTREMRRAQVLQGIRRSGDQEQEIRRAQVLQGIRKSGDQEQEIRRAKVLQGIRGSGAGAGAEDEEGTGAAGDQEIRS